MVWVVAALFLISAGLFLYSYLQNKQALKIEQREIDTIYMTMTDEINKLQTQMRKLELENEVFTQASGMVKEELHLVRDMLDLYKRGYTIEGIAGKMNIDQQKVEELLTPYMSAKNEGRKVANEA